ncbi:MAG TPA: hypothetical protein VK695_07180 [Steroidobacteraceae bacterium]|jgi:hypothetical protein|nr:hypothetical protein [Steroidobacteraceae bacterium]
MMRTSDLEQRRQALLMRCEAQRAELSVRLAQAVPRPLRGLLAARDAPGSAAGAARHPLAWLAALAGLMVFGRAREVLTFFVWTRSALTLVSRLTQVASLVGSLRRRRKMPHAAAER